MWNLCTYNRDRRFEPAKMHIRTNLQHHSNTIVISIIALIVTLVIGYHLRQKVESYADYIDTWNTPMYSLMPSDLNVFLINLDSKKERLDNFINAYKHTDFYAIKNVERMSAVNGHQLELKNYVSERGQSDIDMIESRGYRIKHNQLTRGAVGCYLSHMNIYKAIRDRPENYAIIFEDDVKFLARDVYKRLRVAMATVPDDWDMLLMGCVCHVCKVHPTHKDLDHFFLLHAYVIKKSGAIKILNELEFMPVRQQIDSELSVMAIDKKIKVYCLSNQLVWQDPAINKTTIQTPLKVMSGVNPYSLTYS